MPSAACEAPRADAYLLAEGVTSGYNKVPVVRDVSLQVGIGEIVLVMGPNGAGKSTVVKTITGKLRLISGRISLGGQDMSSAREEVRSVKGVGYVPQTGDVFPTLTVTENLEMGGYRLAARDVKSRIEEVYSIFPTLAALRRRPARTLSGGERKSLGIARALVAKPTLLILDEPTANLSPLIAMNVLHRVVETLAATGCAVLLIEQRVSLGLSVATWGYVLTDGQVRLDASGDHLRGIEDLGSLFLAAGGAGARSREAGTVPVWGGGAPPSNGTGRNASDQQ